MLPALEELQSTWEKKQDDPRYELYKDALTDGLEKLGKYYSQLNKKPCFILALSMYVFQFLSHTAIQLNMH